MTATRNKGSDCGTSLKTEVVLNPLDKNSELTATLRVITGGGGGDHIAAVSGNTALVLLWTVTS